MRLTKSRLLDSYELWGEPNEAINKLGKLEDSAEILKNRGWAVRQSDKHYYLTFKQCDIEAISQEEYEAFKELLDEEYRQVKWIKIKER